eukprot:2029020-Pyramimonas_sp.AAC.1
MSARDWCAEAVPGCSAMICMACSKRAASFAALSSSWRRTSRSAQSASTICSWVGAAAEVELPGS